MRLTGGCCGILCVKLFIPSATHSFMRSSTSAALPQEHKLFRIGPYCWLGVLAFIDGSKERNFWLKVNNVIWITWSANVPDDKGDFIYLPYLPIDLAVSLLISCIWSTVSKIIRIFGCSAGKWNITWRLPNLISGTESEGKNPAITTRTAFTLGCCKG